MKMTGSIAERYISAVERETERTRLFTELLAEQIGQQRADKIEALREQIAILDGEGDY